MKTSSRKAPASLRGSTLVGVVIFTGVILILIHSILSWSVTERRLNARNALRLESRNAAEALAEYGFSQIRQKFEARSTFSLAPDGTDALQMPPSAFWTGSNIDVGQSELIGGTIETVTSPGSSLYYVDPADPNNEFDPLKGKWVFRRDVAVVARAIVNPPTGLSGGAVTSYVTERISVRGAPLFAHAIFYNMDLEIFPGPTMNIYGPVHANGNIYVSSQGNSLNFRGTVTASGHVYHAWKSNFPGTKGTGNESLGTTPVRFLNRSGDLVDMKSGSTWKDSLMGTAYNYGAANPANSDFRSYASQTWHGNLQTASHGISNYTPVAIGRYEEDPTPTDGVDNSNNSGRAIIEPSNYPVSGDPNYDRKMEIEAQKYANDAGIYVKVNPQTQQIVSITSRSKSDPTKNKVLVSSATTDYKGIFKYNVFELEPTSSTSGSLTPPTATGSGTTKTTTATQTKVDNYKVKKGMYDRRRNKGVDLLEIDIGKLKDAVTEMAKAPGSRDAAKAIGDTPTDTSGTGALMTSDWTGIIYIEVEGGPTTGATDGSTIAETIAPTTPGGVGVRIVNGKRQVPSYGTSNEGLTIATNAPMYVKGSYNADGSTSSGGSDWTQSSANKPETGEVPAALAADAITLLSEGFNDENTFKEKATTTTTVSQKWKKVGSNWVQDGAPTTSVSTSTVDESSVKPGSSGEVEVAAALLMGLTPTYKDGVATSSGGAHNFPRFLETWNHATWIRGSLVSLFESRAATEPWSTAYYGPPTRNWGFNDLFRQGRFPPGTPRVMSYRRVDFTDLNASQYTAVKSSFGWTYP